MASSVVECSKQTQLLGRGAVYLTGDFKVSTKLWTLCRKQAPKLWKLHKYIMSILIRHLFCRPHTFYKHKCWERFDDWNMLLLNHTTNFFKFLFYKYHNCLSQKFNITKHKTLFKILNLEKINVLYMYKSDDCIPMIKGQVWSDLTLLLSKLNTDWTPCRLALTPDWTPTALALTPALNVSPKVSN